MLTKRSWIMAAALLVLGLLTGTSTAAASAETEAAAAANNQFALDLYRHLGKQSGNLFFSPYCINKALAMVAAGARGETEQELARALHFSLGERQHRAFRDLRAVLNAGQGAFVNPFSKSKDAELYLTAGLWGARGAHFDTRYSQLLRDCYGSELHEVDFADAERVCRRINAWVEEQTRRKIQDLLQPGALNADTRLVLASAIYFKGAWTSPFQKSATRDESFWITPASKASVKLMHQTGTFGYFEDADCQALRMPYAGKKYAMVVFLPRKTDGLPELEKKLSAQRIADTMKRFSEQKVRVWVPRLKMTQRFQLNEALAGLGVQKAFGKQADFSAMNGGREPLRIDEVVHKAFVDMNEEGTEAAAATAVSMNVMAAPRDQEPPMPVFRADHPFVFAICDVRAGVMLFLGRMQRP